jgi:hypothetical protein
MRVRPVEGVKDKEALFLSKQRKRMSPRMVELLVKKYIARIGLDTTKYTPHKYNQSIFQDRENEIDKISHFIKYTLAKKGKFMYNNHQDTLSFYCCICKERDKKWLNLMIRSV